MLRAVQYLYTCVTTFFVVLSLQSDMISIKSTTRAWTVNPVSRAIKKGNEHAYVSVQQSRLVTSLNSADGDGIVDGPSPSVVSSGIERAKALPEILRFRGIVDQGYGRGGKKLGVPTANLPASLFQNALENISTGVYFGWTALERQSKSEPSEVSNIYKAVVNVGFSPTFEGQENPEKIIEAHLILNDDEKVDFPDFYGVTMRLQLIGFLRDEKKFDSFPDLIAQIQADIKDAKNVLDEATYNRLKKDPFLDTSSSASSWVGSSGGDETASWEFTPMVEAL